MSITKLRAEVEKFVHAMIREGLTHPVACHNHSERATIRWTGSTIQFTHWSADVRVESTLDYMSCDVDHLLEISKAIVPLVCKAREEKERSNKNIEQALAVLSRSAAETKLTIV